MTAPTRRDLGQMRHLDLLALAAEAEVAPAENQLTRFGALTREQLVDALTRTGPMARLAERAETRLTP